MHRCPQIVVHRIEATFSTFQCQSHRTISTSVTAGGYLAAAWAVSPVHVRHQGLVPTKPPPPFCTKKAPSRYQRTPLKCTKKPPLSQKTPRLYQNPPLLTLPD